MEKYTRRSTLGPSYHNLRTFTFFLSLQAPVHAPCHSYAFFKRVIHARTTDRLDINVKGSQSSPSWDAPNRSSSTLSTSSYSFNNATCAIHGNKYLPLKLVNTNLQICSPVNPNLGELRSQKQRGVAQYRPTSLVTGGTQCLKTKRTCKRTSCILQQSYLPSFLSTRILPFQTLISSPLNIFFSQCPPLSIFFFSDVFFSQFLSFLVFPFQCLSFSLSFF